MPRVFISYARADDVATRANVARDELTDAEQGWVTLLEQRLRCCLTPILKPRFHVDLVRDVNPPMKAASLDELMSDQVVAADALLCVISPRFVDSDWTLAELSNFVQSTPVDAITTTSRPVFKVLKMPLPDPSKEPMELQTIPTTVEMYALDETGSPRDLHPRFGPDYDTRLWQRAADLAREVARRLEHAFDAVVPRGTIYVAETESALDPMRVRVRRTLQDRGFAVLPARIQSTYSAEGYEDQVKACLAEADLSVHLLGHRRATIPAGGTQSIEAMQLACAREAPRPRGAFVWQPQGVPAPTDDQRPLLTALRRDPGPFEIFDGTLEALMGEIERAFPDDPGDVQNQGTSGEGAPIYLRYQEADEARAEDVADVLAELGVEVEFTVFEGTPDEVEAAHARRAQTCAGTLIIWGAGSEGWVDNERHQLKSLVAADHPLGVFVAPDASSAKARLLRRDRGPVLDGLEGIPQEALAAFVQQLKPGGSTP